MAEAVWFLVATGSLFGSLLLFYSFEDRHGNRVVLKRVRGWLDAGLCYIFRMIQSAVVVVEKSVVQTLFRHGLSSILRTILHVLRRLTSRVEQSMRQHKVFDTSDDNERMRTHLDDIAEHKIESALTEEERRRRLDS